MSKESLLEWCQQRTNGYSGVDIKDFSVSWRDGLAFAALIHSLQPQLFNYTTLASQNNPSEALKVAFDSASQIGVAPLLDVDDIASVESPEPLSIQTYVSSIYHTFKRREKLAVSANKGLSKVSMTGRSAFDEKDQLEELTNQIKIINERNKQMEQARNETRISKERLTVVEKELSVLQSELSVVELQRDEVRVKLGKKEQELLDQIENQKSEFDTEIANLQAQLAEATVNKPTSEQLALKRRLDAERANKERFLELKKKLELELASLKDQLQREEKTRADLVAQRKSKEEQKAILRQKHRAELLKLEDELAASLSAGDNLQEQLQSQDRTKQKITDQNNTLNMEISGLTHELADISKDTLEFQNAKKKLARELVLSQQYLVSEMEDLRILDKTKQELEAETRKSQAEREQLYQVKMEKAKEKRQVDRALEEANDEYDKQHSIKTQLKRDVRDLELKNEASRDDLEFETKRHEKTVKTTQEKYRTKHTKQKEHHEGQKSKLVANNDSLSHKVKVNAEHIEIQKARVDSITLANEELEKEKKSASSVLDAENSRLVDATRLKKSLERELEKANKFLSTERKSKGNSTTKDRKAKISDQIANAKAESEVLNRDVVHKHGLQRRKTISEGRREQSLETKKVAIQQSIDSTTGEVTQQQSALRKARATNASLEDQKAELSSAPHELSELHMEHELRKKKAILTHFYGANLKAEREKTAATVAGLDADFESNMEKIQKDHTSEKKKLEEAKYHFILTSQMTARSHRSY